MGIRERLSGNEAVALCNQADQPGCHAGIPDHAVYRDSTVLFLHILSNGEIDTEFIPVESEHSAMSACDRSRALPAARDIDSNLIRWSGADVGGALRCSFQPSADRTGSGKP